MRTDGQTDMTKLIVAFRNFAKAPKNSIICPQTVFMCFVSISEQTAIKSLYSINRLIFIMVIKCVYWAERTESLKILPWLKWLVAGLSLQRSAFDHRSLYVRFVMDKVAPGHVCVSVLRFPLPLHSTNPPYLSSP
jgi:hypothetical protein